MADPQPEHQHEPTRILAIDGGGIGGIIPAGVLAFLEQKYPTLIDRADVIAGTSTGGFIALGLARRDRVRPARLVELYRTHAREIFPPRLFSAVTSVFRAKHSPGGLRRVIGKIVGDERLSALAKPVLIPVVAIERPKPQPAPDGRPREPGHVPAGVYLSTVHKLAVARLPRLTAAAIARKDPPAPKYASDNWRCVDAALGTSAAPTYFPAHVVPANAVEAGAEGRWVLWDGGLVANNPAMVAYHELSRFVHGPWPNVRILSLGTGYRSIDIPAKSWGQLRAVRPVISTLMDASVGSTAFAMRQLLEERAVRVNVKLTSDYDMDDPDVVPRLERETAEFCGCQLGAVRQPDGRDENVHEWLEKYWFDPAGA